MENADITQMLEAAERGDSEAASKLLPLVYDELRRLAARKLAGESPDHTLEATALVHEAYLRLIGPEAGGRRWSGQRHFFAVAAEAMRRILIDEARKRRSLKRGGNAPHITIATVDVADRQPPPDLLALNEALDKLAVEDPVAAELVKLRYFGGLTLPEVANVLTLSPRGADRLWAYARAWLRRELAGG